MNWTCLIYGGSMFLAMSWYAISARRWFKGPRINVAFTHGETPARESQSSDDAIAKKEKQAE